MTKRWASVLALAVLAAGCGPGNQEAVETMETAEPAAAAAVAPVQADLSAVLDGDWRSAENRARDIWRHPLETLEFFGIEPDMSVVEIWPAAGWYTEILAPFLRDQGQYIAAHWDPESPQEFTRKGLAAFKEKLAERPDVYGEAQIVVLSPPDKTDMVEPGSVDMVLTFRNIHNWLMAGQAEPVFGAMYAALKPGGVLGVVEHRAATEPPADPQARSGYVSAEQARELAEQAGFVFEEASEINANPQDSKDHPAGVWTLPPTFAKGDEDREKYGAIGESDRFTMRFRKPVETD